MEGTLQIQEGGSLTIIISLPRSSLVGLILTKMGYYPHIMEGGYDAYRTLVSDYLHNCQDFTR